MKVKIQAALMSAFCCWHAIALAAEPIATPLSGAQASTSAASNSQLTAEQTEAALIDYRTRFLEGKTAQDMKAFIARHQDDDPEKRVPRAQIRMRTFAAFEKAVSTHQCNEAKKLHQRISGYKVTIPFSYDDCKREQILQKTDPESLYVAGVRSQDNGEFASARTLYRIIVERFAQYPIALKAADRLAHLAEIESLNSSRDGVQSLPPAPALSKPTQALHGKSAACPKDLGYIRSQMVFAELRDNPSFDEPIDGIIHKAGGLDAAIAELERLVRENERPLNQAASAVRQYDKSKGALTFRCEKPEGGFCAANYYYHLLNEGGFYYAEMLNSLRCRKTGKMEHAPYEPAPVRTHKLTTRNKSIP